MSKIEIKKNAGPIVFLGSMNAMPMMYAYELKKLGYEVIYFVDSLFSDVLNRPENHFPDISYPYPDWIVEFPIRSQLFVTIFRRKYAEKILTKISKLSQNRPQAFFLNGFFISLASINSSNAYKLALSHGSDLDSWANVDLLDGLSKGMRDKSFFKYMPDVISKLLISRIVQSQYKSLQMCDRVIYFPKGFNKIGDKVIGSLRAGNTTVLERYDISFEPLKYEKRGFKEKQNKLIVFSGVRFNYVTFDDGNAGYNKGNDIIIKGLALYYRHNKNIEIHFVEKGVDVDKAKNLCESLGLSEVITWHNEMPFYELLKLYDKADICFDQVGDHWIGAIGGYALWLGKPLIANDFRAVSSGAWPVKNPVESARNEDDVYKALLRLEDNEYRKKSAVDSMEFAENYFGPMKLINNLFDLK